MKTYTISVGAHPSTIVEGAVAVTPGSGEIAFTIHDDVAIETADSDVKAALKDLLRAAREAQRQVENT